MPNILKLLVENPDEILNAGAYEAGAIIRLQTATTETGTYADVAGTGSTPTTAILAAIRIYTGYDPAGATSSWYRTRFENSGATRLSDWVAPYQIGSEEAGELCSLYDVRQRLESNGATLSNTEQEQVIEYGRQVTSYIQGYTGRRFARRPSSGTTTFLFDVAYASRTLWVPKGIAEASLLEVATQTGGAFTTVTAADWFLDPPATGRDHGWPATRISISDVTSGTVSQFYVGKRVVRVTMAEGWASVPHDIANIALTLVVASFRERASSGGDAVTVGIDGERRYERALSYKDRMLLDWYRVRHY